MLHQVRWTAEKITRRIALVEPLVYRRRRELPPFRYRALSGPLDAPPIDAAPDTREWPEVKPNSYWGEWRRDFVLLSHFDVPTNWDADSPVALHLPLGEEGDFSHPEALVYVDGVALAACDRHHQEVAVSRQWRDGRRHDLALHGWTGLGSWTGADPGTRLLMRECSVVEIDRPTRDFVCTARVALGVAMSLADGDPAQARLLSALDEAFKTLDTREPFGERFYASVEDAHAMLRRGIEAAGPPLDVDLVATGHAHLDVAWLWTLDQTRGKAGRTFHTVLALMDQFPDYHFTQSQPQLYEFVRADYPDVFEGIKKRVADGRWEPIGGMWVEADCNVTGPESLARQFLLGRAFFAEHFGSDAEAPVLWLPDVFGYCWALPQLIKQAGLEYFTTIKIGWSQYNRLPYDSFWWQGLDGTRVLTHFSTTPEETGHSSTYNAEATPKEVLGAWESFRQKELQQQLLMIYGRGDGGGGPTREMLENIREMASFPSTPKVRQGSAGDFFRRLEVDVGTELPVWNGELYLEYHRGTYTTQGRIKRANRKSEFLLHDAEFAAVLAASLDSGYEYPAAALTEAWKLVCLNQFHDVLPGSGIGDVYVEALEQYEEVATTASAVRDLALATVAGSVGGDVLLLNATSFARDDPAMWSGRLSGDERLETHDGRPVTTQSGADGTWIAAGSIPPFSVTPLVLRPGVHRASDAPGVTVAEGLLENDYLRVELNTEGDIARIFDKANRREVLPEGGVANQFQAFEDRPLAWDAWDVDIYYDDRWWPSDPTHSIEILEEGPLRASLRVSRRIGRSSYEQTISLTHDSAQLRFDTIIDWRERHVLLKVAFPVEVLSPTATFDIQWGNVERPTHRNTSWDWARFETCAQKWVDLSEGDYGVSLLNDCKYGHDVRENVMRLTLLRSPTAPDPEADQGEHRFTYSLLPHAGRWNETTISAAYALNDPIVVTEPRIGQAFPVGSLVAVDRANVVIETVKGAEDGRGFVVRLYESQRRRGATTLTAGVDLAEAWLTNLIEEDQSELEVRERSVLVPLKPYEIVTLRLIPTS